MKTLFYIALGWIAVTNAHSQSHQGCPPCMIGVYCPPCARPVTPVVPAPQWPQHSNQFSASVHIYRQSAAPAAPVYMNSGYQVPSQPMGYSSPYTPPQPAAKCSWFCFSAKCNRCQAPHSFTPVAPVLPATQPVYRPPAPVYTHPLYTPPVYRPAPLPLYPQAHASCSYYCYTPDCVPCAPPAPAAPVYTANKKGGCVEICLTVDCVQCPPKKQRTTKQKCKTAIECRIVHYN